MNEINKYSLTNSCLQVFKATVYMFAFKQYHRMSISHLSNVSSASVQWVM